MFRNSLVIYTIFIILGLIAGCTANNLNNYVSFSDTVSENGEINSEGDDTSSRANPRNNNNSYSLNSELFE